MNTGIEKVIKDGDGNAIIYTALIAAAISNSLPTPMDAIYFMRQQKLKEQLEKGEISVKQYWYHDVAEYYFWTTTYYLGLITIVAAIGGNYKTNARILLSLVGAGVVIGVTLKNIQKDQEIEQLKKEHDIQK